MQEEEAALLSMGAVLKWWSNEPRFDPPPGFVWENARFDTNDGYQIYVVAFNSWRNPQTLVRVSYWLPDGSADVERTQPGKKFVTPAYWYPTVAEAKAACEVHALTGQFPLGVEPDNPEPFLS